MEFAGFDGSTTLYLPPDATRPAEDALRRETSRRIRAEAELSRLMHHALDDQEAERRRIARELHDRLGQSLTMLTLGLDGIGRACPASAEVQQRVAGMKTLAAQAGFELSRLAWEIRPAALDDLGLQAAAATLLDHWRETSTARFELFAGLDGARLRPAVETVLYRVLQEALTNTGRHAQASRVSVSLSSGADGVAMAVADDGCGFDLARVSASAPPLRLGLLGMRERLALVGGTLAITSAPGAGTTVLAHAPQ